MAKHIHIYLGAGVKVRTADAEWNESQHKRDDSGKFGSGGGGGKARSDREEEAENNAAGQEKVRAAEEAHAKRLPRGTAVRFHNGEQAGKVLSIVGNTVTTTKGTYHATKLVASK